MRVTRVSWRRGVAEEAIRGAVRDALPDAADAIRSTAVALSPDLTGQLDASSEVTVDAATLSATISFDTEYAVAQHEALDWHHDQGQAKYLEAAAHQHLPTVRAVLADEIRARLGR